MRTAQALLGRAFIGQSAVSSVRHVGILPSVDLSRVHVGRDGQPPAFSLPAGDTAPQRNVGQASQWFSSLLGVPVTIQRPLWVGHTDPPVRAYVLQTPGSLPDRWMPIEEVGLAGWSGRSDELIVAMKGEDESPPWYSPTYRQEVESWLREVLARNGEDLRSPIRQVRQWTLSAVWVVDSTKSRYFFKGGIPDEGEAVRSAAVAKAWPAIVPQVEALDPRRGWLLTKDVGGTPLSKIWSPEMWARAAREYGRMQAESTVKRSDLGEVGQDVRSMSDYYTDAQRLLADESLTVGSNGLTTDEMAALHETAQSWLAATAALVEDGDILALDHGDFDAHQVMVVDGSIKILDWGEAAFSHPLIDIESYLRTLHEGGRLRGKSNRRPLRLAYAAGRRLFRPSNQDPTRRYHGEIFDSYLGAWRDHPMYPAIRRSRSLIAEAFPLLRAVGYWRALRQISNPWEAEATLPHYVRSDLTG